jgi:hypothetical protein
LPAIQREFVWSQDQIRRLWMMRQWLVSRQVQRGCGRVGINLVFDVRQELGGGWSYRLRPEARQVLEEECVV